MHAKTISPEPKRFRAYLISRQKNAVFCPCEQISEARYPPEPLVYSAAVFAAILASLRMIIRLFRLME